jgi:hypothetical protein
MTTLELFTIAVVTNGLPLFIFLYAVSAILCLGAAYIVKRYDGLEE